MTVGITVGINIHESESYTVIADIVFDAGWSKRPFVKERKVKRHATAISLYVAVGL